MNISYLEVLESASLGVKDEPPVLPSFHNICVLVKLPFEGLPAGKQWNKTCVHGY